MGYFDQFEEYKSNSNAASNNDYFSQFEEYGSPIKDNTLAQPNVITREDNIQVQTNPTVVQAPANNGVENLYNAARAGAGEFVENTVKHPWDFVKGLTNTLLVQPIKEFGSNVLNPDVTKSPWLAMGGGVAKGAISLPQNLWNIGANVVNTYNGNPNSTDNKLHYVQDIANAMQGNELYQNIYQKPKEANPTLNELGSFAPAMYGVGQLSKLSSAAKLNKAIQAEKKAMQGKEMAKYMNEAGYKTLAKNKLKAQLAKMSKAEKEIKDLGKSAVLGGGLNTIGEYDNASEQVEGMLNGLLGGSLIHGGVKFGKGVVKASAPLAKKASYTLIPKEVQNAWKTKLDELRKGGKLIEKANAKDADLLSEEDIKKIREVEATRGETEALNSAVREGVVFDQGEVISNVEALEKTNNPKKQSTTVKSPEETEEFFKEKPTEDQEVAAFVKKFEDSKKAWEEQKQQKEQQPKEQKYEFIPEEEPSNAKPWNTDKLPHLTAEEARLENEKVQQLKWNEKRKTQKESEKLSDYEKEMMELSKKAAEDDVPEYYGYEDAPNDNLWAKTPDEAIEKHQEFVRKNKNDNIDELRYINNELKKEREFSKREDSGAYPEELIESADYVKELLDRRKSILNGDNSKKNYMFYEYKQSSSKSDLSHVKSETDINTPKKDKTLNTAQTKSVKNENMKLDFANAKGQSVKHGIKSGIEFPNAKIDESKVTRIEGGTAEGVEKGNKDLYTLRTKPERKTNSLDSDNYVTESPQEQVANEILYNENGGEVNLKEWNKDLDPEDSWNLNKEIENYKPSNELKSNKQVGTFINKKAKDVLGVNDLLTRTKSPAITKALQVPFKRNRVKLFIKQLCGMKQSKQTKTALENLYFHADNELRSFINNEAKKNNLPYEFTNQVYVKGKAREQKAISNNRSVIDEKAEHFNESRATDKNTGINPYYGDAPAENTLRDAKTWREVNIENNNSAINNTVAKKMADAIAQGRNAIPEKIKGLKAKTVDIIKYSKVYKEGSKLLELAKKYLGDVETIYDELEERRRGYFDRINTIKLNYKDTSVFTHDHEVAHVIFDRYVNDSTNLELNYRHSVDVDDIGKSISNMKRIEKEYNELISEIGEYKKFKNTPNITANDLKNVLTDEEYKTYREYEKHYFDYKNTINEQFADCVSKGYFDGTPDEFIEIYDKIKPEFDKLVEEGKLYGTETELQELIRDEFRRNQGEDIEDVKGSVQSRSTGNSIESRTNNSSRDRRGNLTNESRGEGSEGRGSSGSNTEQTTLDKRYDEHGNLKKDIKFFDISRTPDFTEQDPVGFYESLPKQHREALDKMLGKKMAKLYGEIVDESKVTEDLLTNKFKVLNDQRRFQELVNEYAAYVFDKRVADLTNQEKAYAKTNVEAMMIAEGAQENIYTKFLNDRTGDDMLHWFGKDKQDILFGHKEGKIREVTDVKKLYAGMKARRKRLEAMNEMVDFFVEHFGKPLELTKRLGIKEVGEWFNYVPVNVDLLKMTIFKRGSRKMFDTLSNGEEAIKKAFKGEDIMDEMLALYNQANTAQVMLPRYILNSMFNNAGESLARRAKRYGAKEAIKASIGTAFDIRNYFFKRRVLGLSPKWFINNRIGNYLMMSKDYDNPLEFAKDWMTAWKVAAKDLPAGVLDTNILDAVETFKGTTKFTDYKPIDDVLNLLSGKRYNVQELKSAKANVEKQISHIKTKISNKAELVSKLKEIDSAITKANVINKLNFIPRFYNGLIDLGYKVNNLFENHERKMLHLNKSRRAYKEAVDKGEVLRVASNMYKQRQLLDWVNDNPKVKEKIKEEIFKTLGDYNSLTNVERGFIRRAIPFIKWDKVIIKHCIDYVKNKPEKAAILLYELKRLADSNADKQDWQKLSIDLGDGNIFNLSRLIPQNTLSEFTDATGLIGMLSPIVQENATAIKGRKTFKDMEIKNSRYSDDRYYVKDFQKNKWIKQQRLFDSKKQEFRKDKNGDWNNSLPLSTRLGYVGTQVANDLMPYMDNNLVSIPEVASAMSNKYGKNGNGTFMPKQGKLDVGWRRYNNGDIVDTRNVKKKSQRADNRYATEYDMPTYLMRKALPIQKAIYKNPKKMTPEEREQYYKMIEKAQKAKKGKLYW